MSRKPRIYISFLLRMWQVQEADRLVWRAMLDNPHTGAQYFFASLPRLYQFLLSGGTALEASDPQPGQPEDEL
ncbi:MAG: hypothetical protein EHM70_07715 [Chloroflexota bacterium]|nr:MAG: hypothetical protein EHM70_07715 [Chloroflexota bacterium]